jgi:hypothetical protein
MQSCLEKKGIEGRNEALVRNDYQNVNEYSAIHPDALSDGDPQGKGTGYGGHTHSVPNCNLGSTMIDYSNFDTNGGGGLYDIEGRNGVGGRNFLKNISLYNEANQYSATLVDTTLNRQDGQIVI